MNITLSIGCGYSSVFLINGHLSEGGEIIYGENEVVYITVLPLDAVLLPYTVKLVGGRVKSNDQLAKCYRLGTDRFFLKLAPRSNYVYAPASAPSAPPDLVERFFSAVLNKSTAEARRCLSNELSESINDQSLLSFFDDFADVVAAPKVGFYYLIDKNGSGFLYEFVLKNGVIDNIIEV